MVDKARLASILYKYYPKRVSAKFLSSLIPGGTTKSEVNSILYSNLSDFSIDSAYNWQLTSNAYESTKRQMQYKERKIDELCTRYNTDHFIVKNLIDLDYQSFENAYNHAEYIAKCGNEMPYLISFDWLQLITKDDVHFYQEVATLREKQARFHRELHDKYENESKIRTLCIANGISDKSCKKLLYYPSCEVECRINEIKAFMRKMPLVSISISQAVLLSKEEFMNYKNTLSPNPLLRCTLECTLCTKNCILKQ